MSSELAGAQPPPLTPRLRSHTQGQPNPAPSNVISMRFTSGQTDEKGDVTARIDWRDIKAALAIGLVYAILLLLKLRLPRSGVGASATIVPFILTVAYIISRGRQEPGKLDTWGVTSPISGAAALIMAAFTAITAVLLASTALMLGGDLDFSPGLLFRMAEYLIGAFPPIDRQMPMIDGGSNRLAVPRPDRHYGTHTVVDHIDHALQTEHPITVTANNLRTAVAPEYVARVVTLLAQPLVVN